jgi:hypothetical protein
MFGESYLQKHNAFSSFVAQCGIPLQRGEACMHDALVFTMIFVIFGVSVTNLSVFTRNYACQNTPVFPLSFDMLNTSFFSGVITQFTVREHHNHANTSVFAMV